MPQRSEWQQLLPAAEQVLQVLRAHFARYTPSANEAQTEEDWIRPVLRALGHTFEVQAALKTPDGIKKPDYIFYRDQAAQLAQKGHVLADDLPSRGGLAVGDAKHWDRSLDSTLKAKSSDPFSNKNPLFQIHFYMLHSGAEWGILTNGRLRSRRRSTTPCGPS
ncbi:hypothetical protein [Candidatus Viridilinea mediisalina]|uniref:hypothetical protein n=1 Tax=Candidatus Viridilinea mediisalina TaxID=2024553 RepID=UPI000F5A4F0F|nr:hypothetical protein [Candidatus Viridilinea mediisalina]